jgi:hypothetical protein
MRSKVFSTFPLLEDGKYSLQVSTLMKSGLLSNPISKVFRFNPKLSEELPLLADTSKEVITLKLIK